MYGRGARADTRAIMRRRTAAHALAQSLARRLRGPAPAVAPQPAPGLETCIACHRDFVQAVEWEEVGQDRWWMFLRCAECGISREVTVSNAVAARYDDELADGAKTMIRAARRLEHERMAAEAEAFLGALHHGLIEPADFAR